MLETILSVDDYRSIPESISGKIDAILNKYIESFKKSQEEEIESLRASVAEEVERKNTVASAFDKKCREFEECEKKLTEKEKENLQLKSDIIRHRDESQAYKIQRDETLDQKSSLECMLDRRTKEIEELKIDRDSLLEKLKAAVQAKVNALSLLDEIQSKKVELDFKEKRLDQERELLTKQINLLTNDVTKHSQDLVALKRQHTSEMIVMQAKLQQKEEEIRMLTENEEKFKKTIQNLNETLEEQSSKLTGQSEIEIQLQQKYVQEIESRSKLAEVYKEMSEESNKKAEELAKTTKELQNLLNEASDQYKDLEKRFAINEATYKEHLSKKNETIAALKRELFDANNLIDSLKQDNLSETLDHLSPHAAAAYNMMQKGLTLTQIYTEYANVSEQLMIKTQDNEQLQDMFKSFIEELEGKALILKKRNEDYAQAMNTIEKITQTYDQLELDYNVVREKLGEAERHVAHLTREKEKSHKTISDLGRQICFLLKEIEECRGGDISMTSVFDESSLDTSDILNSSDVISKKLVTFRDIQELQKTNQKLLNVVRDLSEEFEKAESKMKECNKEEMEEKIKNLESILNERKEAAARQDKIIQMLKNQVKMYQTVYGDSVIGNKRRIMADNLDLMGIRDTVDMEIQTSSSEIENLASANLRNELNAAKKELAERKSEIESLSKNQVTGEKMMLESLEKAEQSYQKLLQDNKKILSQMENSQQKCKNLESNVDSLKTEIATLENRCKMYLQTIGKHEETINSLREEAMNAITDLSKHQVMLQNARLERDLLKDSESRLRAERDVLKQDKEGYAHLLSNLESIKVSIERSESERNSKMEEKLDSALKECSALRRRLQDEQDRFNEKIAFMEQTTDTTRNRLEEEKNINAELSNMTKSLKTDLNEKNKIIDELKEKLKMASSKSVDELELLTKSLQNKYQSALKDVEHQKELLNLAKRDNEEMTRLSENFEKQLVSEKENYNKCKNELESKISEMEGELVGLRKHNDILQKRVNELSNMKDASMIDLNNELMQEKRKCAVITDELDSLKEQLSTMQKELNAAVEAKLTSEKKYTDEMLQHTNDIKELQSQVEVILELNNKIATLTSERDAAVLKADSVQKNWREEETRIKEEMEAQNEKLQEVLKQNEALLNKIQELSISMAVTQRQEPEGGNDTSSTYTGQHSNESWGQVIFFLKREKNAIESERQACKSENMRLKSEIDLLKRQLEETHIQLKAERDKNDISNTTYAKHAELMEKVQTFSAVIDSNRLLREERDKHVAELAEVKEKLENIETQIIAPLRNDNKRLTLQVETLQLENHGLHNRVSILTKELNKTNSEDVKDLKKSLNVEREAYNKTLDDLRSVKQEKSKLEEQIKKLQAPSAKVVALEKERNDLQKELASVKTKIEKVNQDFSELQKNFLVQEDVISKMKSSNIQIKGIARKYKSQCIELTEQVKELQNKQPEAEQTPAEPAAPVVPEISVGEQNRLRQEGRQQMETEMNDRLKQLNDQITTNRGEIDRLMTENKTLQETVAEKEVRATDILQHAKTRILSLAKQVKKHQMEAKSYKERMQSIENATREEGAARENVIKSTYESRISKLEKEKTETQNERDRLSREIEVLNQRVTTLQRQLLSQQGVKSNVNSSQEKSNIEPPTANIKPMAGPTSSVTKSQQNQQSVAVTPWRSASETPLASIRPMSLQSTRTAAVLPTSQTSCSASQSTVMVPPQQQLVDTSSNAPSIVEAFSSSPSSSSHSDYNMPSTSSSVSHTSVRQVVVTPTQQTSHSAESTQDMEAECGNQELPSQATLTSQQQSSQVSQNQTIPLGTISSIMAAPSVSQSQTPTVALVLPRIDLSTPASSHLGNAPEQSVVASSQNNIPPLVSASNQSEQKRAETYYQQDGEDSNLSQVSASNQHSQHQTVASSIETAPEQSIVSASSQPSYDKTLSESSVASSNANSSNTVTTTQAGLKRAREAEGESSKTGSNTDTTSIQPQTKRTRRVETVHDDLFRNDIDESSNADMLLRYGSLDVEYQVPTSSQRDQEFDNLVIDSEAEDELEEDEQTMPDDGIIDENDEVQEYAEDDEEVESEEVYEMEGYDREEQDTTMTSFNVIEGPDIDEESVQVQDQDNEVEIIDEESNEVPNQSGRADGTSTNNRRNLEQQSSEATSSGNNMRAQSASITSNQSSIPLQFGRRPSTISPLNRQQNQQLLLVSQGFEDSVGDDSIVPSTPTLCVPRRTDGFGEAVSSPHVPSGGRFTFSESNPPNRAAVIQVVSEGIDDTRMDLTQLEENSGTGRSVPSTPLQSSPQDVERIEVGQSGEDPQPLPEELSSNTNQGQQPLTDDILIDTETFHGDPTDNEIEVPNESENLVEEPADQGREENADTNSSNIGVTSDSGQTDPLAAGPSRTNQDEIEEGREAEAATKNNESKVASQPIPTTGNTARRSSTGRIGRLRGNRTSMWSGYAGRGRNMDSPQDCGNRGRGGYRDRRKPPKPWFPYGKRYP